MKNKIKRIAKGDFQVKKAQITLPETSLILTIGEGEVHKGYFDIIDQAGNAIRGLVYSSSYRMHLLDQGFEGNPVRVNFEYDGRGLKPGHVEKGVFTIVCSGGEFKLPFTTIIEKPYLMTNYGKIQNTEDFKRLAIKDYTEAQRLFKSREFYEVLKYENPRIFCLYDNMRKWALDEQAMEEFLVGIKQKECIFLTLPGEGVCYEDIKDLTKATVQIIKNTWGYLPIQVQSEGEFIHINRTKLTTDDFVGNVFNQEFLINPEKLHAGRNFGKIRFITPYEIISYDVEVLQNMEMSENHLEIEFSMAQILKEYVSCVAGRIDMEAWARNTIQRIKKMRKIDPADEMLQLFEAHVNIFSGQIEDAKFVLENYNYNRFAIGKDPKSNAYYLFLNALLREEGNYVEHAVDDICKTYLRHQDSVELFLMLLNIDPQYRDIGRRVKALETFYHEYPTRSVLFLLEAYTCFDEKSSLLKKLGPFEIAVMNFAAKYRMISKELALYVANLASQNKKYSSLVFRLLVNIYKMYPDNMILTTICTLLIKGNKMERKYFVWYQKAVAAELKIAQLYEYFMSTIGDELIKEPLPKLIFLYFMHGNTLNYKKAALLYANLILNEESEPDLYKNYKDQMSAFAWDQLLKRHINDSLKVIYKRFCNEEEMNGERLEAMRDMCFAYEVKSKAHDLKCALVIEKDGSVRQRVPYKKEGMVVYLYDKEARIVWESMDGNFYTDSIPFETRRLFYEPRYVEMCNKYMSRISNWRKDRVSFELNFDNVKKYGINEFDTKEVFRMCSKHVKDTDLDEDEFMLYLCFELFKRGYYDKVTLSYLANYYCGATKNMKDLWKAARKYDIVSVKLAERIITQMMFSENRFREEDIFIDYYINGTPYFRLKQAYLACACRDYVVFHRAVKAEIFDIVVNELLGKESLADVCKIALLEYYSDKEYSRDVGEILHRCMIELCEKQIIFPFYLKYEEKWLRETQIYDKVFVSYQASSDNNVRITYKMKTEEVEGLAYHTETLSPMYENIYVKDFVLFHGETIKYSFKESNSKANIFIEQEEQSVKQERCVPAVGKYGKLYAMSGMNSEDLAEAMKEYSMELYFADQLF